jgi:hypothetical protein
MRTYLFVAVALATMFSCKSDSAEPSVSVDDATDSAVAGHVEIARSDNAPAQLSRQQAIEKARSAGFLGADVLSSGFADTNVYGSIVGVRSGRKQIKTAQLQLVVTAYDDARTKLDALVAGSHGTIESTNVSRRRDAVSDATIVLRIPPDAIAELLPKLRKLGEVMSEATATADITNDYDDTAAKLDAARVLEKRLLQLAASPNGKIEDVLAVERELASVRGEIEAFETKIREWNGEVATSALTVQMTTKQTEIPAPPPPQPRGLGDRIGDDFHASIDSMSGAGEWLVSRTVALLPWLVITLPVLLLLRRLARRVQLPWAIVRRRKAEPSPSTTPVEPTPPAQPS